MSDSSNPQLVELTPRVQQFVDNNFAKAIGELGELVKIPGIAWPSFDANQLVLSAEKVKSLFDELGIFDFVEIRQSLKPSGELGSPAVLARRAARNGALHVLLYAHHDVQPPADAALWDSEPFIATLKGDRLFGRGASDDKAGIITHLYSLRALRDLSESTDLGITVFIEGEEEAGSESFSNFLSDNRADLAADLIVVADSGNWSIDTPALTTSLRGMVSQTFTVRTLDHAVHSGMFGGPLPDAMTAMIKLLASFHDELGNVAIEGLKSLDVEELPFSKEQFAELSGLLPGVGTMGSESLLKHNWGAPALTVIGIDAPTVALSSNTAQPEMTARVSLRLAPNQDPSEGLELLRKHILGHAPFGAMVEFGHSEQGPGYLAKAGWGSDLAHEAFSLAWGAKSVSIGIGGSIPFISEFAQVFPSAEILVTGVEDPDSRAHSPNESQHLPTLKRAIVAQSLILLHGNHLKRA